MILGRLSNQDSDFSAAESDLDLCQRSNEEHALPTQA